jgi:hypothetical protein
MLKLILEFAGAPAGQLIAQVHEEVSLDGRKLPTRDKPAFAGAVGLKLSPTGVGAESGQV